ncbi:FadR/GntR family transcriptional regulator [Hydrogenophaga sp.]|uniref:FadR/GntR family transcriptional regulator n=1 Tax=Hydrogenophaga sp. TaxID=1904254 RepID=UPI0026288622|nr:FadR/GntR family transcriptional regulator [Hydrogenophaga sp.]MCW5655303.1 FadR family transcriptional regulator [Hydrogenophaga sp.]
MSMSTPLREAIVVQMRAGQWRAGDRLPPERDLAERFGVSRTTVRKALGELKQMGLIEQTVGSGTYVAPGAVMRLDVRARQDSSQHTSPAELMEARLAMEPAIIEMAIRNANSADLDRMDDCCTQAENADSLEAFEHWDGELHQAIADAAHNSFVGNVFSLMKTVRAQSDWGQLKKKSVTPERRMAYQTEHRAIVEALRDRDAERARALTLAHLLRVRQNLLGY